jgi:stress-induced-phosphoprotein 1
MTDMSAASFKEQGNKFLQAGAYDEAIEAYTKAIEMDSTDHIFYSNRSAAYLSKGDAELALSDGEKCIELNESFAKGYSRKGAALHALKRYDDAIECYNKGLEVAPNDSGLTSGLAEVEKAQNAADSRGGGLGALFGPQMISKLAAHPKFGPKLADPTFMMKLKMIQTNPQMMMQDPEMMEVLQVMLGGLGGPGGEGDDIPSFTPPPAASRDHYQPRETHKPEPVLTPEEQAVKEVKDRATAAKDRGNALYKEKKFDEALAAYDEAIAIDETNILYHSNKAAVYIEMGQCDKAIQLCEEALELGKVHRVSYEDKSKLYQRIAAAYVKKNELKTAIEFYTKAQMEQFDKATERKIKTLELEFKKNEIEAYVNPELGEEAKERGNAAFRDNKYGEAVAAYEEAIKRDPKSAPYRNNLAAALQKVGDFNGAKTQVIYPCLHSSIMSLLF